MLSIHPTLQLTAIFLALYTFWLGAKRLQSVHFHRPTPFPWKRHVLFGKISLLFMLAGVFGGMAMVYLTWHGFLITGRHGKAALALLPLLLFGLVSGVVMDRNKKKRAVLNILHGTNNTLLLILALLQILTGVMTYRTFVLGIF